MTIQDLGAERAASPADAAAIAETVADYYLGWFDGNPERMARALHPSLAKRGWRAGGDGRLELSFDSFDSMVGFTREGAGRRDDPAERRYEMRDLAVHRHIASVNVFAVPYVDLLHLVRTTDGWRIVNALWCRP